MIPKECKRLAEVDFPIAIVSKHSAREKSIRHGHPSTLHLWWARRPLAACRAMLLGLLLPDPCDRFCPEEFKAKARVLLPKVPGNVGTSDEDLRKALLHFIGDFSNWDLSSEPTYLEVSRGLVKAAHPEETPLVVDPFAGGGSIPLEALRLGCEAFASDLNPVACLILKVMLEDIPRHGLELAEELRRVGGEIKKQAEKELAEFYPKDRDGAVPIAYLWARTVKCESPNCGAEIPLARSFWLCTKAGRHRALKYNVVRPKGKSPHVEFEIFEPKNENEVPAVTMARAKATCLCCGAVLPPERVRAQLSEQHGGADVIFDAKGNRTGGTRMLAVVTIHPGTQGRSYRLPTQRDYDAVWSGHKRLRKILAEWERGGRDGLCPVPDEQLPPNNTNCFRIPNYGVRVWSHVFNQRQNASLAIMASLARSFDTKVGGSLRAVLADAMAIVVSRCADASSSLSAWRNGVECNRATFARQALSMVWDFCEAVSTNPAAGGYDGALNWVATVVEGLSACRLPSGQVHNADATEHPLPNESSSVFFTDPPYYDAVGYAELSDFFFVWLKRATANRTLLRDVYDPTNPLVPKVRECVQDERYLSEDGHPKDRAFFETTMARAFGEGRRVVRSDGMGCVVFAHKTTEGWEALLSGMIQGGWTITGSWPIATERPGRLRSQDSAALATSVHLVCRPRPDDAPVGDWGEVLRELPKRVGDWMERLQGEGIRGADLVFACIGPALEIFSRYCKVETADGREVKLAEYLEKVWEVVGRTALEQILGTAEARARNGMAGVLEEDARLTALFLWTLQATNGEGKSEKGEGKGNASEDEVPEEIDDDEEDSPKVKPKGYSLVFDVVRRFAQPLGIELPKWEGRVIETKKGVVRLMAVSERAKQLFGEEGAEAVADLIAHDPRQGYQQLLFPEIKEERIPRIRGRGHRMMSLEASAVEGKAAYEATTLDRVHAAMLLQTSGQSNALRALIKASRTEDRTFCVWRMHCPPYTRKTAKRNDCSMPCSWRCRGNIMLLKVFSKRHKEVAREVLLSQSVRNRIWYLIEECDPYYDPNSMNNNETLAWDALPDRLKKEHGWQELRAYKSQSDWETLRNAKEFVLRGIPRFVLDAVELFYDLLLEDKKRGYPPSADPVQYQSKLNVIFEDVNLPWRLLEGRIIRVDSKWLETEIHAKAAELLAVRGFEGALAEFQQARSDLSGGDFKGAINASNLALESTMKAILGVDQEKPGMLIRKLIDTGLVPDYHEGFLRGFEEHILRSVPTARSFEKGVGHGQGIDVSNPPKSLAELAVNLTGVLILYLLKRHLELHPSEAEPQVGPREESDDVPF